MDDLTDLWLVDTVNLDASDLDVLLNNLAIIQRTDIEGILYMTQANYDAFGPLLAAWNEEDGHHVEFVMPGDFDTDGDVDGADFLSWQLNDGSQSSLADWQAEFGDVVTEPLELRADFDGNDRCDSDDLLIWETNFGAVDPFGRPLHEYGDADEDGDIDGSDFLIWQTNYGIGVAAAATTAIPEPTTILLAMFGMTSVCCYRHRR